jgi:hypothetical protein
MKTLTLAILSAVVSAAADKPIPVVKTTGSDQKITIEATLILDPDAVKARLDGINPGPGLVLIHAKVTPIPGGEPFFLSHDDFILRSDKTGERVTPLYATQIAGSSVMVVSSKGGTAGAPMQEQRRIPIGVPGVGIPGGRGPGPSIPGNQPGGVGSATADTSSAQASIEEREKDKPKALLEALKKYELPEREIDGPVEGLLYYQLEGKSRIKHIEFVYRKSPPRIHMRFQEPKQK